MEHSESKFYPNTEELKEPEKKENVFEVMKIPEIVIREEKGAQLFSLLLKAENPGWGETETPLAKETADYFRDNPLSQEILKTIRDFHEQGVDEETLYNLALTYQRPERIEKVFELAAKYKPHVKNPHEVYKKFMAILESFDQTFSVSPLAAKFDTEIRRDKDERSKRLEETRKRIKGLIDFFKPYSKTTNVQRLNFVPTDPLYRVNSGRNFSAFPGEQIIISHIDNVDNQAHEFCHGIINPIVEKLSRQLTYGQKEKISQLASEKLKQDYGAGFYSLLCEELIRTYNNIFKKGEEPQGIKKNQLRGLVFELYQEYSNRKDKESENFERFILAKFSDKVEKRK